MYTVCQHANEMKEIHIELIQIANALDHVVDIVQCNFIFHGLGEYSYNRVTCVFYIYFVCCQIASLLAVHINVNGNQQVRRRNNK